MSNSKKIEENQRKCLKKSTHGYILKIQTERLISFLVEVPFLFIVAVRINKP